MEQNFYEDEPVSLPEGIQKVSLQADPEVKHFKDLVKDAGEKALKKFLAS